MENLAGDMFDDATPCDVEVAAREILKINDDNAFETEWRALDDQFPEHPAVFTARVRRFIKTKKFDEAVALIEKHDFGSPSDGLKQMQKAELLFEAHRHEDAAKLFSVLIEVDPDHRRDISIRYAKRLFAEGLLARACDVMEPVRDQFGEGGKGHIFIQKIVAIQTLLTRLEGRPLKADENCRILAMKHAVLWFRNRRISPRTSAALGRLCLITGGLGPGGAERQLSRLAIELERARKSHGSIAGVPLNRPVEVLVRTHGPERQNDFYLADIQSAAVETRQINFFPVIPPRDLGVTDPDLLMLLDYLPPSVNFGVRRLTRHFAEGGTETASIWQDGACLFAGLAALMAGVPQIQLAIRGLPPSMRRHMFRPEYEVFYRAMAQVPGVSFISNSKAAADAYADWLGVPEDRFAIVYNGVEPMSVEPSADCESRWSQFAEATADASHTVGGVFRFDTDKQPLLWIRFAARYFKRHPDARFLLVGGGRLLDQAVKMAEDYGIADRILFVGRSTRVGYWMTKMDVLVLLSRFEGLPNVLIEAQYMGVRVVTTPAGGAAECLIEGVTGHVLGCAERPDYQQMIDCVHDCASKSADRDLFGPGGEGRKFLDDHFSVPHMLGEYVKCTSEGLGPVKRLAPPAERSLRAA